MRSRLIVTAAAAVVAATAITVMAPSPVSATAPSRAEARTVLSGATAAASYEYTDFRVPGVRIWAHDDPYSGILGLGYPGQGFNVDYVHATNGTYTCDNGVTSYGSLHGYDIATGVWGFVPICNTTW